MPAFTRDEFLQRLQETKRRMADAGLDALVVIEQFNLNYLSGYEGQSAYVPQCLVVIATEEEPRLIVRDMDTNGSDTFLRQSSIFGYPEDYIAHQRMHPYDYFADLFRQWKIDGKRIGIELDCLTPNTYDRLRSNLPNARFSDVGHLVTWQRLKKSQTELLYMRQAGEIADLGMQAAYDNLAVGKRGCDVAAEVAAALIRGTPEFGGDRIPGLDMPAGPRSGNPHLSWNDALYVNDSQMNIELGGARLRYVAALSRTFILGKPTEQMEYVYRATREGVEAVFDQVKPGWTCEQLDALFRRTTRKHGVEKKSRLGYAIGAGWTEKTASLRTGDQTVLEPDMTFHLMAGMWYDTWGYILSETFQVTDKGIVTLSKFPRDLLAK